MTNLTFAGIAYNSSFDMADAVVSAWLSADGLNGEDTIRETLSQNSDANLTHDVIGAWEVAALSFDNLVSAFGRYRSANG